MTSVEVHLLPFSTKFRGTTNVAQHFARAHAGAADAHDKAATARLRRPKDDPQHACANPHAAPFDGEVVLVAPTPLVDAEEGERGHDAARPDPTSGTATAAAATVEVASFRGRKLLGRRVQLTTCGDGSGGEHATASPDGGTTQYMGVVALVPLATEVEPSPHAAGIVAAPAAVAAAAAATVAPTWKKGPVRRQRFDDDADGEHDGTAAAGTRGADGADSCRTSAGAGAAGRPTCPHVVHVDSEAPRNAFDPSATKPLPDTTIPNSVHPPMSACVRGARAVVVLETFGHFTVWDHDRVSASTSHPALGAPLWFAVADAIHGHD